MQKVSIEIELATCAVELVAYPGDQLMFLDGWVIGVRPKDSQTAQSTIVLQTTPKKQNSMPNFADILDFLRKHPEDAFSARTLISIFLIKEQKQRDILTAMLRNACERGDLDCLDPAARFKLYTLPKEQK